jgi:hypothetical protein
MSGLAVKTLTQMYAGPITVRIFQMCRRIDYRHFRPSCENSGVPPA